MKSARLAISGLMTTIALAALDAAWLRPVMFGDGSRVGFDRWANGHVLDLGLIGMVNVMAATWLLPRKMQSERGRFFAGFRIAGLLAMLTYWPCCRIWGGFLLEGPPFEGLIVVGDGVSKVVGLARLSPIVSLGGRITNPYVFAIWTILITTPLASVAAFGGLVSQGIGGLLHIDAEA